MMTQSRLEVRLAPGSSPETKLKSGNLLSSLKPICMPQSSMIRLPPIETSKQERPTSWPRTRFSALKLKKISAMP